MRVNKLKSACFFPPYAVKNSLLVFRVFGVKYLCKLLVYMDLSMLLPGICTRCFFGFILIVFGFFGLFWIPGVHGTVGIFGFFGKLLRRRRIYDLGR